MTAQCERCGCEGFVLFYLPGAWSGGLCQGCGLGSTDTAERFRDYFGEVRLVTDGDAGKGHAKT